MKAVHKSLSTDLLKQIPDPRVTGCSSQNPVPWSSVVSPSWTYMAICNIAADEADLTAPLPEWAEHLLSEVDREGRLVVKGEEKKGWETWGSCYKRGEMRLFAVKVHKKQKWLKYAPNFDVSRCGNSVLKCVYQAVFSFFNKWFF